MNEIDFGSGIVTYNTFHVDFNKPFEEQWFNLTCSLLMAHFDYISGKYVTNYTLDAGWYPDSDPNGQFVVRLIRNYNWSEPIVEFECREKEKLKKAIESNIQIVQQQLTHHEQMKRKSYFLDYIHFAPGRIDYNSFDLFNFENISKKPHQNLKMALFEISYKNDRYKLRVDWEKDHFIVYVLEYRQPTVQIVCKEETELHKALEECVSLLRNKYKPERSGIPVGSFLEAFDFSLGRIYYHRFRKNFNFSTPSHTGIVTSKEVTRFSDLLLVSYQNGKYNIHVCADPYPLLYKVRVIAEDAWYQPVLEIECKSELELIEVIQQTIEFVKKKIKY